MTNDTDSVYSVITHRSGRLEDEHFILGTWTNGYYCGNDQICREHNGSTDHCPRFEGLFKEMKQNKFVTLYGHAVKGILAKPTTQVTVACLKEDEDVIVGYSVIESDQVLHWVHVKEAWRKLGVAKSLIPITIQAVTHLTTLGRAIKPKHWEYNPFIT